MGERKRIDNMRCFLLIQPQDIVEIDFEYF